MNLEPTELGHLAIVVREAVLQALAEVSNHDTSKKVIQKQFLNLKEASEFLCLAPQTIYQLTSKGLLKHCGKTRKLIFERDVLINYLISKSLTKSKN